MKSKKISKSIIKQKVIVRIKPTMKNYKNIYIRTIYVNGKKREMGEIFIEHDSQEMRNLVIEKYIEDRGEYDD